MEQAIDWCRNHVIDLEDLIAGTFEPVPSINATTRSAEQRSKDLQDALNWLRHQGQNDNAFDPTGEFRKLDKLLPKKRGQRPEERARELEGALDWIRSKDASPADDQLATAFSKS
jgi:hypothetical protein